LKVELRNALASDAVFGRAGNFKLSYYLTLIIPFSTRYGPESFGLCGEPLDPCGEPLGGVGGPPPPPPPLLFQDEDDDEPGGDPDGFLGEL
jgi:hypothetical protein